MCWALARTWDLEKQVSKNSRKVCIILLPEFLKGSCPKDRKGLNRQNSESKT